MSKAIFGRSKVERMICSKNKEGVPKGSVVSNEGILKRLRDYVPEGLEPELLQVPAASGIWLLMLVSQ